MTVSLATIHHEGAGTPSDDPRGAPGGYTYWIGATRWERLRTVDTSYATLHFNHVSLDICLSGNRMVEPVTDNDIALIHGAFMDCHAHGEIVDVPQVQAHRDNNNKYYFNGSLFSTVCPGDLTMARWPEIVAACRLSIPAPPPPDYDAWVTAVNAHPLHYGDRGPNVTILNQLLVKHHFLATGGEAFGDATAHAMGSVISTWNMPNKDTHTCDGHDAWALANR